MSGYARLPMDADSMLVEARRETGIDLEDAAAREPLARLVSSLNEEAGFSAEGALGKHQYLLRFLKNRLRMQRDLEAHPEILDIELLPPVVINGMARTGSTKLQKILAATGLFNWLPMWLCMNPSSWSGEPKEDLGPRIEDVNRYIDWFKERSPQAQSAHAIAAEEPEEDSYIMMHSLVSQTLSGYANAPSYLEWYLGQNLASQFEYVRDTLKYLVWQGLADPNKPFVLKSAMSLGYEDGLLAAYGKLNILVTHRDPVETVPSTCRLAELFRKPYSDAPVDHSNFLVGSSGLMESHMDFRERRPEVDFLDIDYRALRDDSCSTVARILAFAGIDGNDEAIENVRAWDAANPKNRHGSYRYQLADFGFSPPEVDSAFSSYLGFVQKQGIAFPRLENELV